MNYGSVVLESAFCVLLLVGVCFLCACTGYSATQSMEGYADYMDELYPTDAKVRVAEPGDDVNGFLPEQIYIKTGTQTYGLEYQFALVDGRIYYKAYKEGLTPTKWELLNGNGIPTGDRDFPTVHKVAQIACDAKTLSCFDDQGRHYYINLGKVGHVKPYTWQQFYGWPAKMQLVQNYIVKGYRSWGIGTRREEILYYEDAFGNQHNYGTMGIETNHFLTNNGKQIVFTDSLIFVFNPSFSIK